jgi:hypothetical protein
MKSMNTKSANVWTSSLIIFGYCSIAIWAALEPGEAYHGPQIVGIVISFFVTLACIGLVLVGFPLSLKAISKLGHRSYFIFLAPASIFVIIFSSIAALALAVVGLGYEVKIFLLILGLLSIACLPLTIIWWCIAKRTSKHEAL